MRALSHYWRVTRQDNVVAQALLEKAIAFDPRYGQALGLLAASHIFSAHMGWEDMATALPVAERAALAAIHADSEDRLGALRARQRLSVQAPLRRLHRRIRAGAAAQSQFLAGARLLRRGAGLSRPLGGRRSRRARRRCGSPRAIRFAAIYCGVVAYCQFVGRNYEEAIRLAREALRQRGDFVGAHRVLTAAAAMAGQDELAKAALEELPPRAAEHLAGLARKRDAVPARGGAGALCGGVSAGGAGVRG